MRERMARLLALMTAILVLLLALVFAWLQNAHMPELDPLSPSARTTVPADAERIALGREVIEREGCLRCHAIAGNGNPRNPLDGIGARRDAEGIRAWIVADDAIAGRLPGTVVQAKQRYQDLPGEELEAMVMYLQGDNQE
jgi:cytochrome c5